MTLEELIECSKRCPDSIPGSPILLSFATEYCNNCIMRKPKATISFTNYKGISKE